MQPDIAFGVCPISYCRRCGKVIKPNEAIRSSTHDFCQLACKKAHQENGNA